MESSIEGASVVAQGMNYSDSPLRDIFPESVTSVSMKLMWLMDI
jgi:hypothetical protein